MFSPFCPLPLKEPIVWTNSFHLCRALVTCCNKLCSGYVDPNDLSAYTACRSIPFDKTPGVCPIGIVEVVHRILGKANMRVVKFNLIDFVCPLQYCIELKAGCEVAFHFMSQTFECNITDAILLVDASNAFNSLNHSTILLNIEAIFPALPPILINRYHLPSTLYINSYSIPSQEETIQGDPFLWPCME